MLPFNDPDSPLVPAAIDLDRLSVVFFDLPGEQLSQFACEWRRLSQRPLLFRWLATGDDEPSRVLVRGEQPPPLLVWRAMDEGTGIYVEQRPGIWVPLGFRHSRPDDLQAIPDQIALIHPSNTVERIPADNFVSEIDEVDLGYRSPVQVAGSTVPSIALPLCLRPAREHDPPCLWVLRESALGQLTAYCRTTHQQLLARFSVAVSATSGSPCVVLRANATNGPAPVFVGPAVAYYSWLRLPNLFLPDGTRLAPPIRRDAIRAAIAVREDRLVWLHPLGGGSFRVESLPECAFRPLPDWVDYRLADPARIVSSWRQSHHWGLAAYVERPEPRSRLLKRAIAEPAGVARRATSPSLLSRTLDFLKRVRRQGSQSSLPSAKAEELSIPVSDAVRSALDQGHRLRLARPEAANSALERSRSIEARFLRCLPDIGCENGSASWSELAAAYDAANKHCDGALAWLNAIWERRDPPALWAWGWLRAEAKAARHEVRAIDPIPWLAGTPTAGATRAMAAWVVWAGLQSPRPSALSERAADLAARLEAGEHWLPVRAAWLARLVLARMGSTDGLGLARTRDRLSERLLITGMSLELDTPAFLRFADSGVRERFLDARKWLNDKRELVQHWIARLPEQGRYRPASEAGPNILRQVGLEPEVANTRAYADFIFAWGLTRFAEYNAADSLRKQAIAALPADDAVHCVLRDAFEFRILQVRDGKPPRGALPDHLQRRIDALPTGRYAIDRLREHSRILEPTARIDGFESAIALTDGSGHSPARAILSSPQDRLDVTVTEQLAVKYRGNGPQLAETVLGALNRAFELGESGRDSTFAALPTAVAASHDSPRMLERLLERGFAAAALCDRNDIAQYLATEFRQLLVGRAGWHLSEAITNHALRCLRRLGMKKDVDTVLHEVANAVLQGQPIGRLRATRPGEWPAALRVLLHLAGGWFLTGQDEDAYAVLNQAQKDLFTTETSIANRTKLAFAYAETLAQAPPGIAFGRLEELFQTLKGLKIEGSTNEYYSLRPLMLIETAVRAVVSDEFAVAPQVRAWLDADELAVRQRIRDELKDALAAQGL